VKPKNHSHHVFNRNFSHRRRSTGRPRRGQSLKQDQSPRKRIQARLVTKKNTSSQSPRRDQSPRQDRSPRKRIQERPVAQTRPIAHTKGSPGKTSHARRDQSRRRRPVTHVRTSRSGGDQSRRPRPVAQARPVTHGETSRRRRPVTHVRISRSGEDQSHRRRPVTHGETSRSGGDQSLRRRPVAQTRPVTKKNTPRQVRMRDWSHLSDWSPWVTGPS
jgi:hypothetical protein